MPDDFLSCRERKSMPNNSSISPVFEKAIKFFVSVVEFVMSPL